MSRSLGTGECQKAISDNSLFWGYAFCISFHVTALSEYGGIVFPLAIGAVVEGVPTTSQTPLSGHFSPVFAVAPISAILCSLVLVTSRFVPLTKVSFLSISFHDLLAASTSCYRFLTYKPAYTAGPPFGRPTVSWVRGYRPRHPRCHLATPTMLVAIARRL